VLPVLAVDLGATSARVCRVDLDAEQPEPEVIHRYVHNPRRADDGSLRWDWDRLMAEVEVGLRAGLDQGPVASIGVDTWGVDYGLLDESGRLLSDPFSYRDDRTAGWRSLVDEIGADRLYGITGIQLMAINTIFQVAAHDRAELERASRLALLPDLVVRHLGGADVAERTSAGTSALVDLAKGDWSKELVEVLDVDPDLLGPVTPATTAVGSYEGVPVHLVGGHDTASAVAARPRGATPRTAFVSSGTWLLVGAERSEADATEAARAANFSNEPGVLGGVRFLKNVVGFWLLEQVRAAWGDPPMTDLVAAAAALPAGGPTVDVNQPAFWLPGDVEAMVRAEARLHESAGRDVVCRVLLDSLVAATRGVLDELEGFVGAPVDAIDLLGGGSRFPELAHLMAEACGVPVRAGAVEATALGNALVQGVALGRFADLEEARQTCS
jgi:rhamnulokinase